MAESIPITPVFDYYARLHYKGAGKRGEKVYAQRLSEAKHHVESNGVELVEMFDESLRMAREHFDQHDHSNLPFCDPRESLAVDPGLESTDALARWLSDRHQQRWQVLGDDSLSFYYVDRELVSTRAPGAKLANGKSTRDGPRLDLLLANAHTRRPIVGEVKLTRHGSPDKDPFFALIQALASAAYILPTEQLARIRHHDGDRRIDADSRRIDIYILVGESPERSPVWFDLRDHAEQLASAITPQIHQQIATIAGLELAWFGDRPASSRLRITKRFAHHAR
jgi:hypothetical protein